MTNHPNAVAIARYTSYVLRARAAAYDDAPQRVRAGDHAHSATLRGTHVPADLREAAVDSYLRGEETQHAIARRLQVRQQTVSNWVAVARKKAAE